MLNWLYYKTQVETKMQDEAGKIKKTLNANAALTIKTHLSTQSVSTTKRTIKLKAHARTHKSILWALLHVYNHKVKNLKSLKEPQKI